MLAVGLTTGAVFWVLKSINSITESSDTIRVELIAGGIRTMLANPFTGVGINNFGGYSPSVERYPVHNSLFQPAAELGAFGALVFVAVLLWVGIRLVVGLRAAATTHSRNQLKALLAGYTCLIVAIQFDPMAYSEFVWVFLVLAESAVRVTLRESDADLRSSAAMRGVRGPPGLLPL